MVEELFPASVAIVTEMDVDEGIAAGPDRLFNEFHVGFLWRSAALFNVACGAGAHDIAPGGFSAQRPGDDVVEG